MGTRISAQVRSHAQKVLSDYSIANRQQRSDQAHPASCENLSSNKSHKECNSYDVSKGGFSQEVSAAAEFVEPTH